jgi:predicted RNA-binding Zn-ribbon protein involved in translation (DUF1610 family)
MSTPEDIHEARQESYLCPKCCEGNFTQDAATRLWGCDTCGWEPHKPIVDAFDEWYWKTGWKVDRSPSVTQAKYATARAAFEFGVKIGRDDGMWNVRKETQC